MKKKPFFSLELFPPRSSEVQARLEACLSAFQAFDPAFYSVTFGAGGSTLAQTPQTVDFVREHSRKPVAPHLTGIGATRAEIQSLLDLYQSQGITRIIALRGDMPSGMQDPGEFKHASHLVEFIREYLGDSMHISVGAYPEMHPQAASPEADLLHLKAKIEAGANDSITQYCFNFEAYEHFLNQAQKLGIQAPIYPGIMPISNYKQLKRFSETCGAELPRWIATKLATFDEKEDKDSLLRFGVDVVTELCQKLQTLGVPGFHFYSLNRHESLLEIFKNLNF